MQDPRPGTSDGWPTSSSSDTSPSLTPVDTPEPPISATIASQGPIVKLPPETLSQVISHAPWGVCNLRLACRGFRDCAWPIFGLQFKHTDFDIRSIQSMKILKTISEHRNLAPYVTELRFITGFVDQDFPFKQIHEDDGDLILAEPEDWLGHDIMERIREYRQETKYWFSDVWEWTPCIAHHTTGSLEDYAINASKKNIINFLAKTLSKLNLQTVSYHEHNIPADFRDIMFEVTEIAETNDIALDFEKSDGATAINILGLDIVLQALAEGSIYVKSLEIPVAVMYCRSFMSWSSKDTLEKVLAKAESFCIKRTDSKPYYHHHLRAENHFPFTSSLAPKLKKLRWGDWHANHRWDPDEMTYPLSYGPPPPIRYLELPECHYVSFSEYFDFENSFSTFLTEIGPTLKVISLTLTRHLNLNQLIKFLGSSKDVTLEILEIDCYIIDIDANHLFSNQEIPSKEDLYAAAQTVKIEDASLKKWLERHWSPRLDGTRDKARTRGRTMRRGLT